MDLRILGCWNSDAGIAGGPDGRVVTRFQVEVLPEAEAEFRAASLCCFERSPAHADALRTASIQTRGIVNPIGSQVPAKPRAANVRVQQHP